MSWADYNFFDELYFSSDILMPYRGFLAAMRKRLDVARIFLYYRYVDGSFDDLYAYFDNPAVMSPIGRIEIESVNERMAYLIRQSRLYTYYFIDRESEYFDYNDMDAAVKNLVEQKMEDMGFDSQSPFSQYPFYVPLYWYYAANSLRYVCLNYSDCVIHCTETTYIYSFSYDSSSGEEWPFAGSTTGEFVSAVKGNAQSVTTIDYDYTIKLGLNYLDSYNLDVLRMSASGYSHEGKFEYEVREISNLIFHVRRRDSNEYADGRVFTIGDVILSRYASYRPREYPESDYRMFGLQSHKRYEVTAESGKNFLPQIELTGTTNSFNPQPGEQFWGWGNQIALIFLDSVNHATNRQFPFAYYDSYREHDIEFKDDEYETIEPIKEVGIVEVGDWEPPY